METTTAYKPLNTSITAEDIRPGRRYVECLPGYEKNWVVAHVSLTHLQIQTLNENRQWKSPKVIRVTYTNGNTLTFNPGETVAVDLIPSEETWQSTYKPAA